MRRIFLLNAVLFCSFSFAQKKNTLGNWKNKDAEIAKSVFSKYGQKDKDEQIVLKKKLTQSQKKLRIEIINQGDWEKYGEICWFRFVKVNDGDLKQILNTDSIDIAVKTNTMKTENWKDGNGNFNFSNISDLMTISQEFESKKNEKGEMLNPLKEVEIYETVAPILSFEGKVYTHRKDHSLSKETDLSKIVNIYADDKLVKTISYSYEDMTKVGGISINFDLSIENSNN